MRLLRIATILRVLPGKKVKPFLAQRRAASRAELDHSDQSADLAEGNTHRARAAKPAGEYLLNNRASVSAETVWRL